MSSDNNTPIVDPATVPATADTAKKARKPREKKEPGTVPATISFGKHVISADKADQFRARLASEWDAHVAACYTAYADAEKKAGVAPKGKRDWRKTFTLEAKDFFAAWKAKRIQAVIEWYDKYALEAQDMTFEKKKESASVRNTLALSAARLSQTAYMLSFGAMKIALATMSATPETRDAVSAATRELELNSLVEQLKGIFKEDFATTDFQGVVSKAIENLAQQTGALPTVSDDLEFLLSGSGLLNNDDDDNDDDNDDEEGEIDLDEETVVAPVAPVAVSASFEE